MTCYEVLTGRIPFEGYKTNGYDQVECYLHCQTMFLAG
jgi:hypothetical protein